MKTQTKQTTTLKKLITNSIGPVKIGQLVEGTVIEIGKSCIFVDLGPYGVGIVLGKEIKEKPSLLKEIKVDQNVKCIVLEQENENGYIELSIKAADREMTWKKLEELRKSAETLEVKVIQANRGGLLVDVLGEQGFLPASQLSFKNYPRVEGGDKDQILKELNKLVGKTLKIKIMDLSRKENKIIVSEKALSKEEIKKIMELFKINNVYEGIVLAVTDFGVFVKLEPENESEIPLPEGFIHISELDWQLVKDPHQIVKEGEKIKAKVIGYYQGRPSLSLKALKEKTADET